MKNSEKAPKTSLEKKRTDENEQTKSVQEKAPKTSIKRKRTDGNEQTKSVQDSSTAPRDSTEEVRAATSMALEGAAAYISTKKAQRNTKKVWTATEKAPKASLKRRRTDGHKQTKCFRSAAAYVSTKQAQRNTKEVWTATDSGTVLCGSTEEELKSEKEVCAATCTAVEGDTSVSENNKELNQLHSVEKEGDVTEMKSTLPRGFSVDSRNTTGATPLMNAALNGNVQAVKSLIERGADPSLTDNKGGNTLHYAAQGGDTDIISLIHTHLPNIESKTGEGLTPLMMAAYTGKLHAVKWFLEKGATVACESNSGWNTLHYAASGGDTDIISLIHTHLPNIESKTDQGSTPLMVAAFNGKLHAVKWFLEKGATVACEDKRGWNMLHFAAESGDTDIISLIHTHLPNIESKTDEGLTPLMVAAFNGKLHAVKWFLEKGATVACKDKLGWSPLHHAAKGGDPDTIDLILTHLPDVDSKTADGETPLIIAVSYGKLQGVKYLLERGANPLAKDNEGQDSLYHASSCDSDCLDLLLNHVPRSESTTGND
nr:putative ankyrin repeat protein RF_0381 isoform X2 [Pocillopora verrucosa]